MSSNICRLTRLHVGGVGISYGGLQKLTGHSENKLRERGPSAVTATSRVRLLQDYIAFDVEDKRNIRVTSCMDFGTSIDTHVGVCVCVHVCVL